MKRTKLKKVGYSVKIFLIIFSILSIMLLIGLPFITKLINIHFDMFTFMIYPCAFCILYIVLLFIKLFDSLDHNNPFQMENVKRFKDSMLVCFILSILVIIADVITFSYNYYSLQLKVALVLLSIIFFGIGIAFYILSELFKQATKYKEENDLTI